MDWLFVALIAAAIGFSVTRRGPKFSWRKALVAFVIAALVAVGLNWWIHRKASPSAAVDARHATYRIEGTPTLITGATAYFGNDATGDLDGDGTPDTAFLVTQQPGGSGTFYYVVVALHTAQGWVGTNAVLLGDRIAPQTTEIRDGLITANYADRKTGEPFTTAPSVGKSMYLRVRDGTLVQVATP